MTTLTARASVQWKPFVKKYGLVLSLLLLCLYFTTQSDRFLTVDNWINILRQSTINGIISVGMMMVILTRGIDLSVGSVLAFATIVAADLLRNQGAPPLTAIAACLAIGAGFGLVSGLLVTVLRIPPFIATLGMMTFARGAALLYTEGKPITGLGELGTGYRLLGSGEVLGVPVPIFVVAAVFLLAYVLLNHVPFGRFIYSLGDNETAATYAGLPVRRILLFVYAVTGMLAALAGVILTGRLNSAQPTAGGMFEFDAIAAVVVGGTSFSGGEGTLFGTFVGVLLIAVINNGLNLLAVSSYYQDIAKGAVIALALLLYRAIR